MVEDAELLAVAQRIHDELGATELRGELAYLIRAAGEAVQEEGRQEAVDRIYELLCRDEQTRRRLDELLPPVAGEPGRGYEDLAGDRQPSYDRYACDLCDYAWPILDVDDPTPPPTVCPRDRSRLVFRAAGS